MSIEIAECRMGLNKQPEHKSKYMTIFGAFAGMALSLPAVGMASFGVFIVPLQEGRGWGRGEISLAHTVAALTIAVIAPFLGAFLDRKGVRTRGATPPQRQF